MIPFWSSWGRKCCPLLSPMAMKLVVPLYMYISTVLFFPTCLFFQTSGFSPLGFSLQLIQQCPKDEQSQHSEIIWALYIHSDDSKALGALFLHLNSLYLLLLILYVNTIDQHYSKKTTLYYIECVLKNVLNRHVHSPNKDLAYFTFF